MDRVGGISADLRPAGWLIAASVQVLAACACLWPLLRGPAADAGGQPPPSWPTLLAAGLMVGNALIAAVWLARDRAREQRLREALRETRGRLQRLEELLDVWQWRTDSSHRLIELRPPRGAPEAEWRLADDTPLWAIFEVEDEAVLRAPLAMGAPLDDVPVVRRAHAGDAPHAGDATREAAAAGPRRGLLRGRPVVDALGAVVGHHGILRELAAEVPPALAAAPEPGTTPVESDGGQESFSYTVSHDLRAPIRVVEGFTKIVKEDYGRLLDRVGNDHLDRVLGAAARMNNMIDALLALSKLASQPLARQPVNLSQLAGYVADDLRRQWPERTVQLQIEPDMQVSGDPTLLRVVLENLLGNAWKYTAKAGSAQVWFERNPQSADSYTVRDNGAGFDMRFADRLFGVFQRLHSANDFPGTGIGLASVRRIVRRHGGEIWGEAEVNRGARFHFALPQRPVPTGAHAWPAAAPAPAAERHRRA